MIRLFLMAAACAILVPAHFGSVALAESFTAPRTETTLVERIRNPALTRLAQSCPAGYRPCRDYLGRTCCGHVSQACYCP